MSQTGYPHMLPVSAIEPSPTNPREYFDPDKERQLGETLRPSPQGVGFLQKLLVRPWPGRHRVFELVDGERRWRAAKLIGLEEVPVDVRELSTAEVVAIQLVTGDTSEPLSMLEEARGIENALAVKGGDGMPVYSVAALAEKIGCSAQSLRNRRSLLKLPAAVKEAITKGLLPATTAGLLAGIPDDADRREAAKAIMPGRDRDEPLSFREAQRLIGERWMNGLRNAPFDQSDATLPGPDGTLQACTDCTFRSTIGIKNIEVCTLPRCFRGKCNAVWDRASALAIAAGQRVLTEGETASVFNPHSATVEIAYNSQYVALDAKPTYRHVANEVEDKHLPPWRAMLNTAAEKHGITVPVVLARDRMGKLWELVRIDLAVEAARAVEGDMFKRVDSKDTMDAKGRFSRDDVRAAVRSTDDFGKRKKAEGVATKHRHAEALQALRQLHPALMKSMGLCDGVLWDALLDSALTHAGGGGLELVAKYLGVEPTNLGVKGWAALVAPVVKRHALVPILLISASLRYEGVKSLGFQRLAAAVNLGVETKKAAAAGGMSHAKSARKVARRSKTAKKKPAARNAAKKKKPRFPGGMM